MGIRGLYTYLSNEAGNFTPSELHNTYLVIDAENCINHCYRRSGLARQYGGEYLDFTIYVRVFLKRLQKCRITPIFIFDGCHEATGSKGDTLFKRNTERIQSLRTFITQSQRCTDIDNLPSIPDILPEMTNLIFREILNEYHVHHLCCEREADKHIAELAIYLNCPALSNDSDFYIFQPPKPWSNCPVVPVNSLGEVCKRRSSVCPECVGESACYALHCLVFEAPKSSLGCLSSQLRPLLPAFVGNDVTGGVKPPKRMSSMLKYRDYAGMSYSARRIHVAIQWLREFTNDAHSALEELLSELSVADLISTVNVITKCTEGYLLNPSLTGQILCRFLKIAPKDCASQLPQCDSKSPPTVTLPLVLDSKTAVDLLARLLSHEITIETEVEAKAQLFTGWPISFIHAFRRGSLATSILDALYVCGGTFMRILFEDLSNELAIYHVSDKLRHLQYSLILNLEHGLNGMDKLVGLDQGHPVENKRSGYRYCSHLITTSPISPRLVDSPDKNFLHFFQSQLGINLLAASSTSLEERTLAIILLLWKQFSQVCVTSSSDALSTHPVALAYLICALGTDVQLSSLMTDSRTLEHAAADLCEEYISIGNSLMQQSSMHDFNGYSISLVSQLNELQLLHVNLRLLVNLLDLVFTDNTLGVTRPSQTHISFLPTWIISPSGRLQYCLARLLQRIAPNERLSCLRRDWIPKLFHAVKGDQEELDSKSDELISRVERILMAADLMLCSAKA